jgi:hypothetical protein
MTPGARCAYGMRGLPRHAPPTCPALACVCVRSRRMGTMKRGFKSMHHRLKSDMGLDAKGGFKLAMGLGDRNMPAISLFAMPTLDFGASKVRSRACLGCYCFVCACVRELCSPPMQTGIIGGGVAALASPRLASLPARQPAAACCGEGRSIAGPQRPCVTQTAQLRRRPQRCSEAAPL